MYPYVFVAGPNKGNLASLLLPDSKLCPNCIMANQYLFRPGPLYNQDEISGIRVLICIHDSRSLSLDLAQTLATPFPQPKEKLKHAIMHLLQAPAADAPQNFSLVEGNVDSAMSTTTTEMKTALSCLRSPIGPPLEIVTARDRVAPRSGISTATLPTINR